jgi:glycosyltransferase involved in cell wall biosynthesis
MKRINVLCVGPFVSKILCEDAFVFIDLQKKGTNLAWITSKAPGYRGNWKVPSYIMMDGIPVHRLYKDINEMLIFPRKALKKSLDIAKELKPDLIFCSQEFCMRLALLLQKYLKVPIVLRVEVASRIFRGEFHRTLGRRTTLRLFGIRSPGPQLWSWLCQKADALITCDPNDVRLLSVLEMHGKPVYFVPWAANILPGVKRKNRNEKKYGIYVGALGPAKKSQVLGKLIPDILEKTPTEKFIIVGSGPLSSIAEKLKEAIPEKIEYYPQISRFAALELISSSYYGYTPTTFYNYGFFAECWGLGTPLLLSHNVCGSKNIDIASAENDDDLIAMINRLFNDPEFFETLQKIGFEEFRKRSTEFVSDELRRIFEETLKNGRQN